MKGYFRMVGEEIKGKDRINREAGHGLRNREMRKIIGKEDWFVPTPPTIADQMTNTGPSSTPTPSIIQTTPKDQQKLNQKKQPAQV